MKKSIRKQLFFAPLRLCGKNIAFIFACFCFFAACKNAGTQTKIEAQPAKTETATREITDDIGRRVKIPERVERAVSLAPNLTEIVFAVGAGDRLVGVTTFCNYPEETKKIQKIGDTMNPNIENIIALKPQIVLISTAAQIETFTKVLDEQGIVYFVTNPQNLDGIYKSIDLIGDIFGRKDQADEVVTSLKKRVAGIESLIYSEKPVKTFLQISKEPLYTIGKESFITDLIKRAGGVSATADIESAYPKLSKETALALNPDAIVLSESDDNQTPNEVFKNSPAVKNAKVFKINADIISRPAPRIVDALEQLARALHPENFQ
ncbi:MAG: cobalamin-binding protein [Pyrinomonadaceae bacterium]